MVTVPKDKVRDRLKSNPWRTFPLVVRLNFQTCAKHPCWYIDPPATSYQPQRSWDCWVYWSKVPRRGCENEIITVLAVVNYSHSGSPRLIYALWSLDCASHLHLWVCERGTWRGAAGRGGDGGAQSGQETNKRALFFHSLLLFLATFLYAFTGPLE